MLGACLFPEVLSPLLEVGFGERRLYEQKRNISISNNISEYLTHYNYFVNNTTFKSSSLIEKTSN